MNTFQQSQPSNHFLGKKTARSPTPPRGCVHHLKATERSLSNFPRDNSLEPQRTSDGGVQQSASPLMDCTLVQKLVNLLMISGKKNRAYKTLSQASTQFSLLSGESGGIVDRVAQNVHRVPRPGGFLHSPPKVLPGVQLRNGHFLLQLKAAVENVQPSLECKKCRIAGTTYQVPAICTPRRGRYLALRWILEGARKRTKNNSIAFSRSLALELLDAVHKRGGPRERRNQCHKLSEANRGYLRYRWW